MTAVNNRRIMIGTVARGVLTLTDQYGIACIMVFLVLAFCYPATPLPWPYTACTHGAAHTTLSADRCRRAATPPATLRLHTRLAYAACPSHPPPPHRTVARQPDCRFHSIQHAPFPTCHHLTAQPAHRTTPLPSVTGWGGCSNSGRWITGDR